MSTLCCSLDGDGIPLGKRDGDGIALSDGQYSQKVVPSLGYLSGFVTGSLQEMVYWRCVCTHSVQDLLPAGKIVTFPSISMNEGSKFPLLYVLISGAPMLFVLN